jgi:hypothetical protein
MRLYLILLLSIIFFIGCDLETYKKLDDKASEVASNIDKDSNKSSTDNNITVTKTSDSNNTINKSSAIKKSDKVLFIDNDAYDPDYMPLLLSAIHENRWGLVDVGLIIVTEQGLSNKTNILYRSILEEFKSDIPLALAHNTSDRAFRSRLTNNLEEYANIVPDSELEDAIEVLENKLEERDDKTVSYATGGKLIFLSKFLSDPARLELFKLKVKEIIFGLGCNPLDKTCSRDFNLAATDKAYNATKDVYSKLHGKVPFVVVDDKRGNIKHLRALDKFKKADISLMHHLLGTNIYGTYGDHHVGDAEILFAKSREDNFNKYRCNVALTHKSFKAQGVNRGGNDYILINKDININSLTSAIYESLIYRWENE